MKKNKSAFEKEVEKILKPYFYLLVEVENIPSMSGRKIVDTKSFNDILNVCKIIHKPIYYIAKKNAYNFVLFDKKNAYFYTLKNTDQVSSLLDKETDVELLSETIRFMPIKDDSEIL
jgi:hypothetical protein